MSSTRSFKSPGIWAADGLTVIPTTPIAGAVYRDDVAGTANIRGGIGKYGVKLNSAEFNQILFLMTSMLDMMDTQGVLGWSSAVDYSGVGVVLGSDGILYSVAAASGPSHGGAQDPTSTSGYWTSLKPASRYSTGEYVFTATNAAPAGTLFCDGSTIGDAASGATALANASAQALFTSLWNDHSNAVLPIQTSAGGASTRGASAAADWAAHKRLPLPAFRDGDAAIASRTSTLSTPSNGAVISHGHTFTGDPVGNHAHTFTIRTLDGPNTNQPTGNGGSGSGTSDPTSAAGGHTPTGTISNTGGTANQAAGVFTKVWIAL